MTLMSIVKNYASLMALRFLLGLAEAGLFPGVPWPTVCGLGKYSC
jgi:hypothetical protein